MLWWTWEGRCLFETLASFPLENILRGSYVGMFPNQVENALPEIKLSSLPNFKHRATLSVIMIPILQIKKLSKLT